MEPTSPVLSADLVEQEVVYAKDQPEYKPLPVLRNSDGVALSRWKLNDDEREAIANGADIMLSVWTFNQRLQPVLLGIMGEDAKETGQRMGLF